MVKLQLEMTSIEPEVNIENETSSMQGLGAAVVSARQMLNRASNKKSPLLEELDMM